MPDPTFRSASTNTDLTGSATSLSVANPSGLTDGDGQYYWATGFTVTPGGSPVLTAPSGWTQEGSSVTFSFGIVDATAALYRRIASGDGAASFTSDRGAYLVGARLAYQFPHPTAWGSGITLTSGGTASGTSHTAGGITTTQNRQLATTLWLGTAASNWGGPGGAVNERVDIGGSIAFAVYDELVTAAGATGSRAYTSTATIEGHWVIGVFNGRPDRQPAQVHLQAVKRAGFF